MIEQQGQVVSTAGRSVSVRLGGQAGCSACDAGRGCGAGVFGRLLRRRPVSLEFENGIGARAGDAVIVGIPEGLFLRLAARLYLLPVLGGLAGAACGHYVCGIAGFAAAAQDVGSLLAGIAAGGLVLRAARRGRFESLAESEVRLLRPAASGPDT